MTWDVCSGVCLLCNDNNMSKVEQYPKPMEQHQEHVKKKINIGIGGNMAFGGWRKTLGDIGHLGLNEKMTGVKSVCHRCID